MDGKSALRSLRILLNESSNSDFLDSRASYEYIWIAAKEFVDRSNCLTTTQSITTVANQAQYTLNADFMKMYLKNSGNNHYLKYNNGSADQFILFQDKEDAIYQNSTASVEIPSKFYIEDDPNLDSRISSTATAAGASSGGVCTLTDTTAPFADVSAGDIVHNTTDGSDGYVVSKTSNSILVTALFDGTNNDWTNTDAYIIQPQGRLRIVFNPPPSTSGHIVTVYYIQKPAPVFSDYGVYRFSEQHMQAVIYYAAFLYKYRDRIPNFGDKFYLFFDSQVRKAANSLNQSFLRKGFGVNLRGRK